MAQRCGVAKVVGNKATSWLPHRLFSLVHNQVLSFEGSVTARLRGDRIGPPGLQVKRILPAGSRFVYLTTPTFSCVIPFLTLEGAVDIAP